jgi:branched-chain amino acid transport system substrate-binding protein
MAISARLAALSAVAVGALLAGSAAHAQAPIKIGFISSMSGPEGVIGRDLKDAFDLALKAGGNKMGGRPVEVVYGDDQVKPDVGRQVADKMIDSDKVQIVTGINFSNVLLAVVKPILDSGAFYVSANAGPSILAGKQCNPHFFAVAFQNDNNFEGLGKYLKDKGVKKIYFLAPNYPAGKDMLTGFKRYFGDAMQAEVFTAMGQLDYSAEIAQLRAAKPDAVVMFYPGGMGINFVKQYAQAGLMSQIPLYTGPGTVDQTTLPAIGDAALGMYTGALWSEFQDNAANKKFVADFEAAYNRIPSQYAATAYETGRVIQAAVDAVGGKIEDKPAFQKALENVNFDSIRGNFKFAANHFPIQDYYLVQIEKDAKGRLVAGLKDKIMTGLSNAYVDECQMPAK